MKPGAVHTSEDRYSCQICEQGQDKEHLPTLLGLALIPCLPAPSRLWPPSLGTVQLCP
jgi:hypothetical protein